MHGLRLSRLLPEVEVESFNYFRKDSDLKDIRNTNIYVSSRFNLCAKGYRDRGQQILSLFGRERQSQTLISLM